MICSCGKCVLPYWSREFWITLERKGKGEVEELGIWVEQRGKAHTSMQKGDAGMAEALLALVAGKLGIWVDQRSKVHTSIQKVMQECHKHSLHLWHFRWGFENSTTNAIQCIFLCSLCFSGSLPKHLDDNWHIEAITKWTSLSFLHCNASSNGFGFSAVWRCFPYVGLMLCQNTASHNPLKHL
jgi:hypothetical protein